jgi:hypothetical protein
MTISKNEEYLKLMSTAIELDMAKGHLKWSVSELSRSTGFGRPLIYYYFGKNKEDILLESVNLFGKNLANANISNIKENALKEFITSFTESRLMLSKYPIIRTFYLMNREKENAVGKKIRELETTYHVVLKSFFSHLSPSDIDIIRTTLLGLSYHPSLTKQHIENTLHFLIRSFPIPN